MGIYDREYYRREGPSFLGSFSDRGRICKWLIGLNLLFFFIQLGTLERFAGLVIAIGPFTDALALFPDRVLDGQIWRLLTAAFLHDTDTPWHILLNMFVLWWAGSELEEMYGSREFLALYLCGSIFSSVAYTVTMFAEHSYAVGASGGVTTLLVLFAFHYPNRTVLLMFIIPVPMWLLVVLFVGHDFLTFVSRAETHVAVTGHLGGALFGALYRTQQWRLSSMFSGVRRSRRPRSRPALRVYRGEAEEVSAPVAPAPAPRSEVEDLEAELDAVLEKMSLVGKDNLTEKEREILLRASEIYRRRRT